jgi:hypothetical protein
MIIVRQKYDYEHTTFINYLIVARSTCSKKKQVTDKSIKMQMYR